MHQNGPKMEPKRTRITSKIDQKWTKNGLEIGLKLIKNGTKMEQK